MRKGFVVVVLAACLLTVAQVSQAQQASQPSSGWRYQLDLYAWGSGLSGHVGPADQAFQVEESFSSVLDYLDMGAMFHFEAQHGRWGLLLDPFYVDLGDSVDSKAGTPVDLSLKELIVNLQGTYRGYESPKTTFDFTFGGRYNELKSSITPYQMPTEHGSIQWVDPVVGIKGAVQMSTHWAFGYRADVGGFGAGSKLTWTGVVRFDAQVAKHFAVAFGYAAYYADYEKGTGSETFVYDMTMAGPFLGASFRW